LPRTVSNTDTSVAAAAAKMIVRAAVNDLDDRPVSTAKLRSPFVAS
jgi:hypothetical protein